MLREFDLNKDSDVIYTDTGKDIGVIASWIDPIKKKAYIEYEDKLPYTYWGS